MPKTTPRPSAVQSQTALSTFKVEGRVQFVRVNKSRSGARRLGAAVLLVYGPPPCAEFAKESANAVVIGVPPEQYDPIAKALVVGCRVSIVGRMEPRFIGEEDSAPSIELLSTKIAFLPEAANPIVPQEPLREATPEDLAHTLRCLAQTVSMVGGPEAVEARFKNLDALASVCVFGKGHLFSAVQQSIYAEILGLMRHNGKADGQIRPMTPAEQAKCADLWISLLSLAAERVGAAGRSLADKVA
jgi:hypothetical protein